MPKIAQNKMHLKDDKDWISSIVTRQALMAYSKTHYLPSGTPPVLKEVLIYLP